MDGEQAAAFRDAGYQPLVELPGHKILGYADHQFIPEILAHFLVNALVADDGKGVPGRDDEEQDAVAVLGGAHAQAGEGLFGRAPDIAPEKA